MRKKQKIKDGNGENNHQVGNSPPPLGITPMEDHLRVEDPRLAAVREAIRKHLASAPGYASPLNQSYRHVEERWASDLIEAERHALRQFEVADDQVQVDRLEWLANSLLAEIEQLGPTTQKYIELSKIRTGGRGSLSKGPHGYTPVLGSVKGELRRLSEVLALYQKSYRKLPSATKKRNWRAASVAKTARRIWAEAYWKGPDPSGLNDAQLDGYRLHLKDCAPRHDKPDRPGPFGRFLEALIDALGMAVSAKTALDSLRSVESKRGNEETPK